MEQVNHQVDDLNYVSRKIILHFDRLAYVQPLTV